MIVFSIVFVVALVVASIEMDLHPLIVLVSMTVCLVASVATLLFFCAFQCVALYALATASKITVKESEIAARRANSPAEERAAERSLEAALWIRSPRSLTHSSGPSPLVGLTRLDLYRLFDGYL